MFGEINLFCPICGNAFRYNTKPPYEAGHVPQHHSAFGVICSRECLNAAEMKYARMILGKDEIPLENMQNPKADLRPDSAG